MCFFIFSGFKCNLAWKKVLNYRTQRKTYKIYISVFSKLYVLNHMSIISIPYQWSSDPFRTRAFSLSICVWHIHSFLTGFCLLLFEIEMNECYFSWKHIFENFMTPFRNLKIVSPMVWLWDHVWGIPTFEANNISAQLAPKQLSCQIQPWHSRSLCQQVQKHKSNLILAQKSNKCLNWISMEFVLIRLSMQTALWTFII